MLFGNLPQDWGVDDDLLTRQKAWDAARVLRLPGTNIQG